jgi:hypothetical protein
VPNLSIAQAVVEIDRKAPAYAIGGLQQIRQRLKGLKNVSSKTIFSSATTFERWAFHHGGRSELQFNIGIETLGNAQYFRYGVAFSLETSRSLPTIEVLVPKIRLFNEFVQHDAKALARFEMWHFRQEQRSANCPPTPIKPELVEAGVFVFLGALQPIDSVDFDTVLADLDSLLPLYKFVESNGSVSPHKDASKGFKFRAGNRTKKPSTISTQTEKALSVVLRHNKLQEALFVELCAEHGAAAVGTENGSGSSGRIDAVVKSEKGYTFFEIKVGQSIQACIREAIGQLLEYSYWPGSQRAISLVVVGEPQLDKESRDYIEGLQRDLSIPVSYRQIFCARD